LGSFVCCGVILCLPGGGGGGWGVGGGVVYCVYDVMLAFSDNKHEK
jgi:hypothetical protein